MITEEDFEELCASITLLRDTAQKVFRGENRFVDVAEFWHGKASAYNTVLEEIQRLETTCRSSMKLPRDS